jgi:hypothetical protein
MPKLLSDYDQDASRLANQALGKVYQLNNERHSVLTKPVTNLLYHYTSAEGLKGIIETNELWATSAYYLNDAAEISYGCGVLKRVLDEWIQKNPQLENSLVSGFAYNLRKAFGEDFHNKTLMLPIYVACFCEEDNLLTQWRAYGQLGGYSLGFEITGRSGFTGPSLVPEPKIYTAKLVKVEYDRTRQEEVCRSILKPLFEIFTDNATARAIVEIGDHPLFGYSKFLRVTTDLLMEEIVAFKNESFKVENEWRIVVRPRELVKQGIDDGGKTLTPTYFRCSKGMLIPYVKLNGKSRKKLPISSIRSGPTLDKTLAAVAIIEMVTQNGFPAVTVRGSDITVRF